MPAKKKKGEKKGDKKAKDGAAVPEKTLEELDPPISDSTKEFYLIQVRDLEAKLDRYKVKCDELQVKYDSLSKSHSQMVKDRDDIIVLLKKDLQTETDRLDRAAGSVLHCSQKGATLTARGGIRCISWTKP